MSDDRNTTTRTDLPPPDPTQRVEPASSTDEGHDRAPDDAAETRAVPDAPASLPADEPVLESSDRDRLRDRWDELQVKFVDDPRAATADADRLIGEVFESMTHRFDVQRRQLSERASTDGASTEELRTTVRRYRDLFERMLTV